MSEKLNRFFLEQQDEDEQEEEDVSTVKQLDFNGLSRFLTRAREEERRQIGRELHDEVAQSLCLAGLLLEKASESADTNLKSQLDQVWELLQEASLEIKEISWKLRPSSFDEKGLLAAIEELIIRYVSQAVLKIEFRHEGLESPSPKEITSTAYWVVHEALSNVARHAKVTDVSVDLRRSADTLKIRVKDYGCGFHLASVPVSCSGLRGMRERVLLAGGRLEIEAAPDCGTTILVELPFSNDIEATDSRLRYTSQFQLSLF